MLFTHYCLLQMVLPVGFERNNEKLYEEVNIPATDRPPEDFHYMPVYIDTLDEVPYVFVCAYFKGYLYGMGTRTHCSHPFHCRHPNVDTKMTKCTACSQCHHVSHYCESVTSLAWQFTGSIVQTVPGRLTALVLLPLLVAQ